MATFIQTYKRYGIRLAAFQPSKRRAGGYMRSLQVMNEGLIVKQVRCDTRVIGWRAQGVQKCKDWIDKQIAGPIL